MNAKQRSEYNKAYRESHREKILQRNREYYFRKKLEAFRDILKSRAAKESARKEESDVT